MKPGSANRSALMLLAHVTLMCIGAATVLAVFARSGWVPELAAHFRLQYILALAVLGIAFVVLRRPRPALVAAALLLPNIWSVAPYLLPLAVAPSAAALPAGPEVTVVALNLFYHNENHAAVRDYLRQSNADILVLSELTPAWISALRDVTRDYPYWLSADRINPWGLGLYSKYPLREGQVTNLGLGGSVNVSALVALPGGEVQLVGVHLASPTTPWRAAQRNRQLDRLADLLGAPSASAEPPRPSRLLVGDMNLTPYSPYFGDLLQRTGMVDKRRAQGAIGTWPAWFTLLQIPIDHCIADPDLGVIRVRRGPRVGSDHYPLEITLRRDA